MDKLKNVLKAQRGVLTKAVSHMQSLIDDDKFDEIELYLSVIASKYERLEQINVEYLEKMNDELSESEFETHYERIEHYRDTYDKLISAAKLKIKHLASPKPASAFCTSKLPKLELPSFSGEVLEYNDFIQLFTTSIDSLTLSNVQKFGYLKTLLKGEAFSLLSGLEINDTNYSVALKLLKERYGSKVRQQRAHIRKLLSLDCVNAKDSKSLRSFVDSVNKHGRALETLGYKSDEYKAFLAEILIDKVPNKIRLRYAELDESKLNLTELLALIENESKSLDLVKCSATSNQSGIIQRTLPIRSIILMGTPLKFNVTQNLIPTLIHFATFVIPIVIKLNHAQS